LQLKRTPALKAENCQGEKEYKDRVTVISCCNADGSERILLLIVGKFGNPLSLKGLKSTILGTVDLFKNAWVIGRLCMDWLVSRKENGLQEQECPFNTCSVFCSQ
jgi:hypothetical protein